MLALIAAVAFGAPDLPAYRNVAWIADRGEPRDWWAVGPCRYGVAAGGEVAARCPPLALPAGLRVRVRGGPPEVRAKAREIGVSGTAEHLGRWREVTVREVVVFPDGLVADGELVLAEIDGAYGLRVLDAGGGFHGVFCVPGQPAPHRDTCDVSDVIQLDWRAPEGLEGTAVVANTVVPGHAPAYDRALGTLVAAASDAVARLAAGEDLPRGLAGGRGGLPATELAVAWELTVIGRHPDGAALSAIERWTIDVPVGIDVPHEYRRRFDAIGVALVATVDPVEGRVAVRATGVSGEVAEGSWAARWPVWRQDGRAALAGAPWIEPDGDGAPDLVVSGSPPFAAEVHARMSFRAASDAGVTPADAILALTPALGSPSAEPSAAGPGGSIVPSRSVRLLLRDRKQGRYQVFFEADPAGAPVAVQPIAPVRFRAMVFYGPGRPDPTRRPDAEARTTVPAWAPGLVARDPDLDLRLDAARLAREGGWVVAEWRQGERLLTSRAFRLPASNPPRSP